MLERADGPVARSALQAAALEGVVEFEGARVRFTHPLLASAIYSGAPPDRRREAHRRLSNDKIVVDESGQAWLTGMALSELGATDRELDIDVAELLASLAVQLGPDRAVESSVGGLGGPGVARAVGVRHPGPARDLGILAGDHQPIEVGVAPGPQGGVAIDEVLGGEHDPLG